ncbi:2-polyprenyl-6-methoxyphenol hydroxylase-like FAD-dependent oxidoreductase [Kitasatospora gansuensis]|uniref:2-polyprenyl-6-methoxyphenol hydroxylase-like FAD-dependent oxidoreductase n=1 Tax=Kitasatospora gansuensis TaxID=258050 RepID=A0A7W7S7J4_9ACTN|nr:FAD-dependent monooxygenase [Kitasatospora gansuensis]MBB4944738.1 2-polyprenyl-6-methoxyphenol hydroxylase-like FAD-dependent oxidoreductase [Kitasatospora gansuensis]
MRITVIGGGVAGAASAIALRRTGAEVTVHEAYPDPAGPVGSFLSLASNGLRALDVLGCLPEVQRRGFEVAEQRMWSASGRLLGAMPRGRLAGDALRSVTLMRGQLVEALRTEAERAGVTVRTGQRLTGLTEHEGGVRAEFADGSATEADLLVGADGLRSATRTLLDPAAPNPAYAGLYSVSGRSEGVPGDPSCFNMTFGRNGAFVHLPTPDGSTWWSAQVATPEPPDLAAVPLADWPARLAGVYRHEELPLALLRATTEVHRPTLMHTLPAVPAWHGGRVVLVGDAAHPVGAGQGASMALEDAVVLAQVLGRGGSLAEYERLRRARIGRMLKAAAANRDAKTAGPVGRRVNDLVMPLVFRHLYTRSTDWLYTHELGALA